MANEAPCWTCGTYTQQKMGVAHFCTITCAENWVAGEKPD